MAITGTPFRLHYRSNRVPGRQIAYTLKVRLSGPTTPAGLKRIELIVDVAGQRHRRTFGPAPNLRHTFKWDGLDAYDRPVNGAVRATVRVGYVYQGVYYEPGDAAADST